MAKQRSSAIFIWVAFLLLAALAAWYGRDALAGWWQKIASPEKLLQVYWLKEGGLAAVRRQFQSPAAEAVPEERLKAALGYLLEGPNQSEKRRGFTSEIPPKLALRRAWLRQDLASLDFNSVLAEMGGGAGKIEAAVAQIVYTATAVEPVQRVGFFINGQDGEIVLGAEGYVIDRPLKREDFASVPQPK